MSAADERLYPLLPSTTKGGAHTLQGERLSVQYGRQTETHRKPTAILAPGGTPPRTRARVIKPELEQVHHASGSRAGEGPQREERAEGEKGAPTEDGFIRHKVLPSDNLISLAVQYNTTIAKLKRYNASLCLGVHLDHVEYVRIPLSPQNPLGEKLGQKYVEDGEENPEYRAKKAFTMATNCDMWTTNYYLREHNFDLDKAIAAWRSDKFWSLTQQFRKLIPQCNQRNAEHYLRENHCNFRQAVLHWHRDDHENTQRQRTLEVGCFGGLTRAFSNRSRNLGATHDPRLASYELIRHNDQAISFA